VEAVYERFLVCTQFHNWIALYSTVVAKFYFEGAEPLRPKSVHVKRVQYVPVEVVCGKVPHLVEVLDKRLGEDAL
jgi:hypothetical protein